MNKFNLTELQAFKAMQYFLEDYYSRVKSDDIACLLGDMQLFEFGITYEPSTYDPATWQEWIEAINKVIEH